MFANLSYNIYRPAYANSAVGGIASNLLTTGINNLLDNFGVLRLCSRFVRQRVGLTEMDFYQKLYFEAGREENAENWPLLNALVNCGHHLMAPIYSWTLVLDELRTFLIQNCGVPDDSALDAIMLAQHAVLPAHGREFPYVVDMPHDVVAWHKEMLAAKADGHWRDWQLVTPQLSDFPPGRLEVDDVEGAVARGLGCDIEMSSNGVNWDMQSSVSRVRVSQEFAPAWDPEETAEAV